MGKYSPERLKELQDQAKARSRKPAPSPAHTLMEDRFRIVKERYRKNLSKTKLKQIERDVRRKEREARKAAQPVRERPEDWVYVPKPVDWSKINRYLYEIEE